MIGVQAIFRDTARASQWTPVKLKASLPTAAGTATGFATGCVPARGVGGH